MRTIARYSFLFLLLLNAKQSLAAGSVFDFSYRYNNNISNGDLPEDQVAAQIVNAALRHSWPLMSSNNSELFWEAESSFDYSIENVLLNNLQLSALLNYRIKPDLSLYGSIYSMVARLLADLSASDIRRGTQMVLNAQWSKAVSLETQIYSGLTFTKRFAGTAFSTQNTSIYLGADYTFNRLVNLFGHLNYLFGEVSSSAKASAKASASSHHLPGEKLGNAPHQSDDAFSGFSAYRFDGKTIFADLGWNYASRHDRLWDISLRFTDSDANAGSHYQSTELFVRYSMFL